MNYKDIVNELSTVYRDVKREWSGRSPSKYPGPYVNLRYRQVGDLRYFVAGKFMSLYVSLLLFPCDVLYRIVRVFRSIQARKLFQAETARILRLRLEDEKVAA